MFDPKTPLQAGLIFVGGIAVIAYTVLDIHRTTRLNQQPMSPEQTRALQELARNAQAKSGDPLMEIAATADRD